MDGEVSIVPELSGTSGVLANGPESRHVVAALAALLDGDRPAARQALDQGADIAGWAAVIHRLDVAGRALAVDDPGAGVDLSVDPGPADDGEVAVAVFDAWLRGEGLVVTIDLTTDEIAPGSTRERAWVGLVVLAGLVERSGFPPQVVV